MFRIFHYFMLLLPWELVVDAVPSTMDVFDNDDAWGGQRLQSAQWLPLQGTTLALL